jgi:hypothetical protein
MPNLDGAVTALALRGTPGARPLADAVATGGRTYTEQYTVQSLTATPRGEYGSFLGKVFVDVAAKSGTDSWLVSWTEGDILPLLENSVAESWRFTWGDSATLFNLAARTETWAINWIESVTLTQSGVFPKAGTDTWSVAWTETAIVDVSTTATETWSVSWGETGAVTVPLLLKNALETWTVSWGEFAIVEIIGPAIPRDVTEDWRLSWTETGAVTATTVSQVFPGRIRIILRVARIVVRIL